MKYRSTRDNDVYVTSKEAIFKGMSAEGGLFVPEKVCRLTNEQFTLLKNSNYCARAKQVLSYFLTDFHEQELDSCVDSAYTKERFETEAIAPVYKLTNNSYVLELWHGPTCAFKDMALQILPHFLTCSMKEWGEGKDVVILVATSGDTGKAALEGFKDVPGTKIMVFYPAHGVSNIQQLQMCTSLGDNVCVVGIEGNFDHAQNGVKQIFKTPPREAGCVNLSSANSINWGRLVPQMIYYISGYADLLKNEEIKQGEKINIVVPTGNFGNILAAYYAMLMGLPVNKLICASNMNNVLTDFINTGVYDRNRQFHETISPSMDILISSNLERLMYHLSGADSQYVSRLMADLAESGRYQVNEDIKSQLDKLFYAGFADDDETLAEIGRVGHRYSYAMDTHTAVASKVYQDYVKETDDQTKTLIVSTASVFKFGRDVCRALSINVEGMDDMQMIERLAKENSLKVPPSLRRLDKMDVRFPDVVKVDEMEKRVIEFIGNR